MKRFWKWSTLGKIFFVIIFLNKCLCTKYFVLSNFFPNDFFNELKACFILLILILIFPLIFCFELFFFIVVDFTYLGDASVVSSNLNPKTGLYSKIVFNFPCLGVEPPANMIFPLDINIEAPQSTKLSKMGKLIYWMGLFSRKKWQIDIQIHVFVIPLKHHHQIFEVSQVGIYY